MMSLVASQCPRSAVSSIVKPVEYLAANDSGVWPMPGMACSYFLL
jgi:hypothetical protein